MKEIENLVKELQWRGMIHDIMPGTEELLQKETVTGYIGFDPTADSLHIGSLVPIMLLVHLQRAGHNPIALVGGATGMVGDPSGKSQERNLLDLETIQKNLDGQTTQLKKFLSFKGENAAQVVNNYDWFKDFKFLDFIRDIGKHITVNYMKSKDSVKNRIDRDGDGMSFTEFTYQLVQGYDFYHLWKNNNCKLQMGGSDQWGNITTGTELIRRMGGGEAFAITTGLIKKADGSKFGKSEGGNVWLDPEKTSPYKFYQYWLNTSDEDAASYLRIFTLLNKERIEQLEKEHSEVPHLRIMQKALAEDVTVRVHSREAYDAAVEASQILFGKGTEETLKSLSGEMILAVFEGVPQAKLDRSELANGIGVISLLAEKTGFLSSNGEARRALKENSISINKTKVNDSFQVDETCVIGEKYILLQRGKKNYFLVVIV